MNLFYCSAPRAKAFLPSGGDESVDFFSERLADLLPVFKRAECLIPDDEDCKIPAEAKERQHVCYSLLPSPLPTASFPSIFEDVGVKPCVLFDRDHGFVKCYAACLSVGSHRYAAKDGRAFSCRIAQGALNLLNSPLAALINKRWAYVTSCWRSSFATRV